MPLFEKNVASRRPGAVSVATVFHLILSSPPSIPVYYNVETITIGTLMQRFGVFFLKICWHH